MPDPIRLDEAIDAVLDAIKGLLTTAQSTGELLEDVESIVIGERSRPRPDLPAIWVLSGVAQNQHTTAGLRETWLLPIDLVSVVQGDEPEDARRLAGRLAARARTVVMSNSRRLGLAYVNDIVSTSFDAASEHEIDNQTIYSAVAIVTARITIHEYGG